MTDHQTKRSKRTPSEILDHLGRSIVRVPLANSTYCAELYKADFESLMEVGWGTSWTLNQGRVKVASGQHNAQIVARLLAAPAGGDVYVSVRDRNPFNLRRENLWVRKFKPTKAIGRPRKSEQTGVCA